MIILCPKCGSPHGSEGTPGYEKWAAGERIRAMISARLTEWRERLSDTTAVPFIRNGTGFNFDVSEKVNGKLLGRDQGGRKDRLTVQFWADYWHWLVKQSHAVRDKDVNALYVTNPSGGDRRHEYNFQGMDRLYFDCDKAGEWQQLVDFFLQAGIPAIFHESSGSVKRRSLAGDLTSMPTSWHVDIPLAHRIKTAKTTDANTLQIDHEWSHEIKEWKRAYGHATAVFSALAGFGGVGTYGPKASKTICGLDASTDQLCVPRYTATRAFPGGPLPHLIMLPGGKALDYLSFLRETGFEWRPYVVPKQIVKTIQVLQRDGSKREVRVENGDRGLFADVKAALSITDFLLNHASCPVTQKGGGGDYHFCPIHKEHENPSGLPGGPNKTGFHVFQGDGGEQRWRCHGDCTDGGDLIHLAAAIWKIPLRQREAALRLAALIGLDVSKYLAKRVVASTPAFAPEDLELLENEDEEGSPIDPAETAEADGIRAEIAAETAAEVAAAPAATPAPAAPTPAILEYDDDILVKILDTNDRGTYYTVPPPPKQKLATPYGEPLRDPKERRRLRTPALTFQNMSNWLEDRVRDRKDVAKVARAAGALLLSRGLGQRERGVPFVPAHDPERIAATIESVLSERFDHGQAQGEVYDALDNLQNDRPEAGRKKLLGAVGPRSMHELAGAIWRDAFRDALSDMTENKLPTYMEYAKTVVGSDRVRSTPGNGWKLLHFVGEKVRKLEPILPENPTAEQTAAWNKERVWHKSLVRQLTLPFGCLTFVNEHTVVGTGKVLSKAFVLCDSRACTGCSMAELTTEYELALPMWKKATVESSGVVFFVVLEVDTLEEATDLQQHMRKAGRPRLTATGFRNGRPTFMFVTLDLGDQSAMDSFATIWALRKAKRLGRPIERPQRFRIATTEEALGMVAELKLSFHVELAQRMAEVDEPRLLEFMRWAHRRQTIVTRSKKAMPWPTKEQCKALRRSKREEREEELEDGQEKEIVTRHVETGMEVIRSRYPLTLERIIQAARANPHLAAAHKAAVLQRRAEEEARRRQRPPRPAKAANRGRDPVAV